MPVFSSKAMKFKYNYIFAAIAAFILCCACTKVQRPVISKPIRPDQEEIVPKPEPIEAPANVRYKSLKGLVTVGYQGWFRTPGDGTGLKWQHYSQDGKFEPGHVHIQYWPDMTEYKMGYDTPFKYPDGSVAQTFSSHDKSVTDLHFKWMKEYDIDCAFMQRFVISLRRDYAPSGRDVFLNAIEAAEKYDRAVCMMYDLSSMKSTEGYLIENDWKNLVDNYKITSRENNHYLFHNGRPLVVLWGVAFSDEKRAYGLDLIQELINFFRKEGCSLMFGVPSQFHTRKGDCLPDERVWDILRQADVIHLWFVGRYQMENYNKYKNEVIAKHFEWCKRFKVDYIPSVFPGSVNSSWEGIPPQQDNGRFSRHKGEFMWKQLAGLTAMGAECFYISMFDEMDEGTQIFKCTNTPPLGVNGGTQFLGYQGLPSDHYLWIASLGRKLLDKKIPITEKLPERK